MPTPIYHITHINNLESILHLGGLIANNRLKQQQINYRDIAHVNIQDRRTLIRVPCAAGGCLHDYIPFYFAPRSPMLYTIHKGNVQGYTEGQIPVIHIVTDSSDFYDDLQRLDMIDWEIMQAKYWNDTPEDVDRKRRRQAEFLVHQFCSWKLVIEIGVIDIRVQLQVQQILQKFNCQTPVKVYPSWYY